MSGQMILHAGATHVTPEALRLVRTPEATPTWQPVAHSAMLDLVREGVSGLGMRIAGEEHAVWNDGARYFGYLEVGNGHTDYNMAIGVRNSHDKRFPAGFACGSRVFICDNLAFSAEVVMKRKHTRFILDDLQRLVTEGLGKLGGMRDRMDARIASYKDAEISNTVAHDVMIRAVDAKVIAISKLPEVIAQWRNPEHEEFAPRTAWSLFNGFTEVLKGYNQLDLPQRTIRLHGLMDQVAHVAAVEDVIDADYEVLEGATNAEELTTPATQE